KGKKTAWPPSWLRARQHWPPHKPMQVIGTSLPAISPQRRRKETNLPQTWLQHRQVSRRRRVSSQDSSPERETMTNSPLNLPPPKHRSQHSKPPGREIERSKHRNSRPPSNGSRILKNNLPIGIDNSRACKAICPPKWRN